LLPEDIRFIGNGSSVPATIDNAVSCSAFIRRCRRAGRCTCYMSAGCADRRVVAGQRFVS
jgi:hypothetical protein